MRIVGGQFRGKNLEEPDDKRIRPTADRTREALFNILGHGKEYRTSGGPLPIGAKVLDVFCGTGALGIEAISRGAAQVTFMDNHRQSLKLAQQNARNLDVQRQISLINRDGTLPGSGNSAIDLVLMDPPYKMGLAPASLKQLKAGNWLKQDCICVVELAVKEPFEAPDSFEILDERKYGAAKLVFLKSI
jgi:16S rRNA (guanine966-N2)-methyltransferase